MLLQVQEHFRPLLPLVGSAVNPWAAAVHSWDAVHNRPYSCTDCSVSDTRAGIEVVHSRLALTEAALALLRTDMGWQSYYSPSITQ